jgi:hypothetical protein
LTKWLLKLAKALLKRPEPEFQTWSEIADWLDGVYLCLQNDKSCPLHRPRSTCVCSHCIKLASSFEEIGCLPN